MEVRIWCVPLFCSFDRPATLGRSPAFSPDTVDTQRHCERAKLHPRRRCSCLPRPRLLGLLPLPHEIQTPHPKLEPCPRHPRFCCWLSRGAGSELVGAQWATASFPGAGAWWSSLWWAGE